MAIGDVMGVVASLVGVCFSAWGLIMVVLALFAHKTERAKVSMRVHPGRKIAVGLVVALTIGGLGMALVGNPVGGGKGLGLILIAGLLAISFIGLAGLVRLGAERLSAMDPKLSEYAALSRVAFMLLAACCMPIIGWFVVAPLTFAASLGAGIVVLRPIPARVAA